MDIQLPANAAQFSSVRFVVRRERYLKVLSRHIRRGTGRTYGTVQYEDAQRCNAPDLVYMKAATRGAGCNAV